MTLILVIVYYVTGCVEEQHSNGIDRGIVRTMQKIPWIKARPHGAWKPSIRKAVLMFSDQQLVTGLAILGSGFTQLFNKVSSYHWSIIVYLAFYSSITHLTTLTVLRQYFRDHAGIRNWRLALMLVTGSMLLGALVPTGVNGWLSSSSRGRFLGGIPAICYYEALSSKGSFSIESTEGFTTVISILILGFGFFTRALRLSAKASKITHRMLSDTPGNWLRKLLGILHLRADKSRNCFYLRLIWQSLYLILLAIYLDLRAIRDVFESMLWEVRQIIQLSFPSRMHSF